MWPARVTGQNWYLVDRDDKPLGYVFGELLMVPEAAKVALAPPPPPTPQRKRRPAGLASERLRMKSNKEICSGVRYENPDFLAEADRRGLSKMICREAEQSKLALAPPPTPQGKRRPAGLASERLRMKSNKEICSGVRFENPEFVAEADRRGLSKMICREAEQSKLALAPPPTPQVPSATQPAVGIYPAPRPGESFRDCAECPEMVVIPAGSFTMGSPASEPKRYDDEGPRHRVTIPRAFAVGKYEVTFAEWDACVRAEGCNLRPKDKSWGRGNRPVLYVSWDDAKQYLRWLSRRTGRDDHGVSFRRPDLAVAGELRWQLQL
jgi:hypothetical protein